MVTPTSFGVKSHGFQVTNARGALRPPPQPQGRQHGCQRSLSTGSGVPWAGVGVPSRRGSPPASANVPSQPALLPRCSPGSPGLGCRPRHDNWLRQRETPAASPAEGGRMKQLASSAN